MKALPPAYRFKPRERVDAILWRYPPSALKVNSPNLSPVLNCSADDTPEADTFQKPSRRYRPHDKFMPKSFTDENCAAYSPVKRFRSFIVRCALHSLHPQNDRDITKQRPAMSL